MVFVFLLSFLFHIRFYVFGTNGICRRIVSQNFIYSEFKIATKLKDKRAKKINFITLIHLNTSILYEPLIESYRSSKYIVN